MAFKLPSFNLLRKSKSAINKVASVAGSKATSGNYRINTTGVTKTYATRSAARKAATSMPRKPQPLQAANKRTFGQMINSQPKFGSKSANYRVSNAPKPKETFGNYVKRTTVKPLKAANKRTFGQMINRTPRFGSVSKTPRQGETFGQYNNRVK